MNHSNPIVGAILDQCRNRDLDEHYLAYFECFNRQLFFEAHEVLEHIWLPQRKAAKGDFYKGLIQLAGAFVHVQKQRPGPAVALLKLSTSNLKKFSPYHEQLDLPPILDMISGWQHALESSAPGEPSFPKLRVPDPTR